MLSCNVPFGQQESEAGPWQLPLSHHRKNLSHKPTNVTLFTDITLASDNCSAGVTYICRAQLWARKPSSVRQKLPNLIGPWRRGKICCGCQLYWEALKENKRVICSLQQDCFFLWTKSHVIAWNWKLKARLSSVGGSLFAISPNVFIQLQIFVSIRVSIN